MQGHVGGRNILQPGRAIGLPWARGPAADFIPVVNVKFHLLAPGRLLTSIRGPPALPKFVCPTVRLGLSVWPRAGLRGPVWPASGPGGRRPTSLFEAPSSSTDQLRVTAHHDGLSRLGPGTLAGRRLRAKAARLAAREVAHSSSSQAGRECSAGPPS